MNFRKLGNADLKVSTICLGTMTWGEQNNQKEAFEQMNYAFDNEINFFDTAEIYPSPCFEKILTILEKCIKQGKIRYIGLSNETSWGLSKFLEISKLKKLPKTMSIQNPYNLLCRIYEIGLAEISIREKSGLLAYSPLAGGFLTGKYRNNNLPENSKQKLFGSYYTRYQKPNASIVIDKYFNIAKNFSLNFAQMSIKFCEIQKFLTSVIIGATSMEQLKIDIESVNVNLTEEINKEINDVQLIYPNPCS